MRPDVHRGPSGQLDVVIAADRGVRVRVNGLASWLRRVAPARARGEVNVALVSDRRIRELNRTYRRRDYATDVLSFSYRTDASTRAGRAPGGRGPKPFLGDIVIARGVARRQARAVGHSELTELRVLALHGLLHLLGYDHERDDGQMRRLEARLRRKGGLHEGLIERETASNR
jgi:probable rRNA maturation factor